MSKKPANYRKLMSDAKFYEGYSRYNDELDRYETWEESVSRVMDMHREFYKDKMTDQLGQLIDEVEKGYKDKLFLGAQRALQFGGEQLLANNFRLYNCSSSYCDRPNFFGGLFYLLLCGAGVGFSVQKEHISKLPNISPRSNRTMTYMVDDSIEGWADSIDVLLSTYFDTDQVHPEYYGKKVNFDISKIRPKGAYISGGFKAPGGEPLRKCLDKVEYLLEQELKNGHTNLRPIVAYDICMFISDAVISGGVRRSATICMFSKDDKEMLGAKTGNWFIDNPQRSRSNNSVVLIRGETTKEEFHDIIQNAKEFGEPGFIWSNNIDHLVNPCFSSDMELLTDEGYKKFIDLDGRDDITLINHLGQISKNNKVWYTGEKHIIELTFANGKIVKCTPNHVFMLHNETECVAEDLIGKYVKVYDGDAEDGFVVNIRRLGVQKVYDFTENINHWGVVNGYVVHNCAEIGMKPKLDDDRVGYSLCNLTEINGVRSVSEEIFYEQCKYASILGTLQAGYTDFKFIKDHTKEIVDREALIGVGITGMMNNPQILFNPDVQRKGAKIVKAWNKVVADIIGIRQAARTTTIKPSGNSAVLLECSSGIHGEHSKRYIRHVQFTDNSEVAQLMLENNPDMCEPSIYNPDNEIVVGFPITPKDTSIYKDELLGVKQLEYVKLTQENWIEEGTNPELSIDPDLRHNVSNTITVDDWDAVERYIFDNQNSLCGVSLLASVGDKMYPQAPFTEVPTVDEIVEKYGEVSLLTSALIEAALYAFDDDLWRALDTCLGRGEKLKKDRRDLLKRDFVRRFKKFAVNFKSEEDCATCLKEIYSLHKFWKINKEYKDINWATQLKKKEYTDIDTIGSQNCSGGACEIKWN